MYVSPSQSTKTQSLTLLGKYGNGGDRKELGSGSEKSGSQVPTRMESFPEMRSTCKLSWSGRGKLQARGGEKRTVFPFPIFPPLLQRTEIAPLCQAYPPTPCQSSQRLLGKAVLSEESRRARAGAAAEAASGGEEEGQAASSRSRSGSRALSFQRLHLPLEDRARRLPPEGARRRLRLQPAPHQLVPSPRGRPTWREGTRPACQGARCSLRTGARGASRLQVSSQPTAQTSEKLCWPRSRPLGLWVKPGPELRSRGEGAQASPAPSKGEGGWWSLGAGLPTEGGLWTGVLFHRPSAK